MTTRETPLFAGNNWGGPCFALDLSHPAALEIVAETMTRAVDDGFTYLKLDFLYAAALPGRRHTDVPREEVYRDAVQVIRSVVGDDVYLLACGAPIVPSVGVFDAIRVGPDVAPWWDMPLVTQYLHDPTAPSTRFAIATSANRLWLAPLIEPDPDVVYFRRRYNLLSRRERVVLQDLATVCGFRATSDPPCVARRPGAGRDGRVVRHRTGGRGRAVDCSLRSTGATSTSARSRTTTLGSCRGCESLVASLTNQIATDVSCPFVKLRWCDARVINP